MNKIKFSHEYEKMIPGCYRECSTKILEIFVSTKKELSEGFIKYDTEIKTYQDPVSEYIEPKKYYNLPDGKLLIILLTTENSLGDMNLWTTIRRWTPEKEKYYRGIRGQRVEIVIEPSDSKQTRF